MKERMYIRLWSLIKLVLVAAAMMCLYVLLLLAISSPSPPEGSVEAGRAIGWILVPALCATAVFTVSILCGLAFAGDRWMVRPAATIPILCSFFYVALGLVDTLRLGLYSEVPSYVLKLVVPMVCFAVIAFLFSPFFHNCGRKLRVYIGGASSGL
jgi:hypothetical protein